MAKLVHPGFEKALPMVTGFKPTSKPDIRNQNKLRFGRKSRISPSQDVINKGMKGK